VTYIIDAKYLTDLLIYLFTCLQYALLFKAGTVFIVIFVSLCVLCKNWHIIDRKLMQLD